MKEKNNQQRNVVKRTIVLIFECFVIFLGIFLFKNIDAKGHIVELNNQNVLSNNAANSENEMPSNTSYRGETRSASNQFCYLSDISYMQGSAVGWGNITLDSNMDSSANGGLITLIIDGQKTRFLKGIIAHANSTLLYDLSQYDYDYFTSYIGIDESKGANGDGVKFFIYTSVDGENWDLRFTSSILKGNNNAGFVKIDIKDANYLKLYADKNGNDGFDHATYANAKLIKEDYEEDNEPVVFIKTLEEYDQVISSHYGEEITGEYELNLLQREFVKNVGYDILQAYVKLNDNNMNVVSWLMNDVANLRLYLVGGAPIGGNYKASLDVLNRLYVAYKSDLNNTTVTENGVVLGDLYRRMMFSLALTHSSSVGFWVNPTGENISNPVTRYRIYKEMQQEKLLDNRVFEKLNVEEMRWVMDNIISDDQIKWLNYYVRQRNNSRDPYTYINYTFDYNYNKSIYYSEENYEKWDKKYHLSEYGVAYKPGLQKLWMVFEEGSVCGGLSKTGSNINGAYGVPSAVVGQPGHAAYLQYSENANGDGIWRIYNDISGWVESEKGERMILGWGTCNWDSQYQVSYIQLAQAALNNYDAYEEAAEILFLKNVYAGNLEELENIYRKALEKQSINLDAWYGLITTFNANPNKTEEDYFELVEELSENLKYYPLPMWDLWNLVKNKFTSPAYIMKFNLLEQRTLTEGTKITSGTYQPDITRTMSNHLLGRSNYTVTSFSFDGPNAESIVLSNKFDNTEVRWDYSLDGGETWTQTGEHIQKLTKEEIAQINVDDGILIHIIGVDYSENNIDKIVITKAGLPTLYNNDLENKVMGATPSMDWRFRSDDEWTSYAVEEPDLTGDKTVEVRQGPTGTKLSSDPVTLNFTQDVVNDKRKYVPIARLSIDSVSSEATSNQGNASFAIDGNYNTRWHSAWNGSDGNKFIVVRIDKPIEFSAMEFFPAGGGNGNILKCKLLGSIDGINFEEITTVDWANNDQKKSVDLAEPVRLQYIKIVGVNTSSAGGGSFIAAKMFNFYEDITVKTVASFSFDGDKAGTISLIDEFAGQNWKYSFDGGETWKDATADNHTLTSEELDQINPENNIKIKFDGDETIYSIYIRKGSIPNITPFVSDLENRLLGLYSDLSYLEWKIEGQDTWTPYAESEAIVKGNKKLFVRRMATGTSIASDALEYQFTEDNQQDTRRYISVSHQSVHEVSSQENNNAKYAIDANENTRWHSLFDGSDKDKYYVIKLDHPKYISSLEYVPATTGGTNGRAESVQILVSMDGENWTEVVSETNWTYTNDNDRSRKSVDFTPTRAQYVKIVGKRTQTTDSNKSYMTAAVFSLYEDITKQDLTTPVAEVLYSTREATNQDVVVTLVNASTNITITNNDGSDKYTFTENGEFTFEFVDRAGNKGTATATVDWIDKDIPTVEIEYSTRENTIDPVTVTLKPSKEITILNEDLEYTENEDGTYDIVFDKSVSYTVEFADKVGNIGTAEIVIDWIKDPTIVRVLYDITTRTNQDVTVIIESENAEITIDNNNGSNRHTFTENGEFTFEFTDEYGISKTKTVKVDWIDKINPTAEIEYSTTAHTIDPVTVTINPSERITIINEDLEFTKNEDGTYTIVFEDNGEYIIDFIDEAGNCGQAIVTIDWIREKTEVVLSYSIEELTNEDVEVTLTANNKITIDNNNGSNQYTFTENGEFIFEFTDETGNKGTATAIVDWIDKDAPTAEIEYNITENTVNPVRATLKPSEEITTLNNDGKDTYVFNDNGSFTFEFVDKAGNKGTATATVDWINKISGLDFIYSTNEFTKEDVEVTLVTSNDVNITITNNNESNKYVFTENGEFTFEYIDGTGNEGTITAIVDWIDKIHPTAEIEYSTNKLTNEDVVVTLKFSEEVTILNKDLEFTKNEDGTYTIVFDESTELLLEFVDKVGNKGQVSINIDWIDKEMPTADFEFSTKNITEDPVIVTLNPSKKVTILNNDGSNTYTFTENGEFTFEFVDEAGNRNTATVHVNWIRKAPKLSFVYNIDIYTNEDVIVTLVDDEDNKVNVINNNGSKQYTFKTNESFTFEYIDEYGIAGSITATVDWIDKDDPTVEVSQTIYNITNEDVVVTMKFNEIVKILSTDLNIEKKDGQTHLLTVTKNGKYVVEYMDKAGNKCTTTIEINNIDKDVPTAEVSYSTTGATSEEVIATIRFNEKVQILTKDVDLEKIDDNTYTIKMKDNGELEIEFKDEAGNIGKTVLSVKEQEKTEDPVNPTESLNSSSSKPSQGYNQINDNNSFTNDQSQTSEKQEQGVITPEKEVESSKEDNTAKDYFGIVIIVAILLTISITIIIIKKNKDKQNDM